MTTTPIGDLAQFRATRSRIAQAQRDLSRSSGEVSTGLRNDIGKHLKGDFARLTSVERTLRLTETYLNGTALAKSYFSGMQSALARAQDEVEELGPRMLAASGTGQTARLLTTAVGAEEGFGSVVQGINTQNGGRSPFAGTATNGLALLPAGDILNDLETLVAAAPDAATMISLVDNYFMDPAGGYETIAYLGDTTAQTGFTIDEGEIASSDLTALDVGLRRTLAGLAMASMIGRGVGPADAAALTDMADASGEWMREGYYETTQRRAELGVTEARIDNASTRHITTRTILAEEQADMVSADPFEAAVELQSVETRLETLYLMTARLQRLTLAEYL